MLGATAHCARGGDGGAPAASVGSASPGPVSSPASTTAPLSAATCLTTLAAGAAACTTRRRRKSFAIIMPMASASTAVASIHTMRGGPRRGRSTVAGSVSGAGVSKRQRSDERARGCCTEP